MHYAKNLKRILKSLDPKDRELVKRVNEEILRTKSLAGTVHNNATLTNLSVQYANEDFIGEQLMPVVGVPHKSDDYYVYSKRTRWPSTSACRRSSSARPERTPRTRGRPRITSASGGRSSVWSAWRATRPSATRASARRSCLGAPAASPRVLDRRRDDHRGPGVRFVAVRSMSSGQRPPRRHSSHGMPTVVLPRDALAPIAPTVDRDAETMVPCPCCSGTGLVTSRERANWLEAFPELRRRLRPDLEES